MKGAVVVFAKTPGLTPAKTRLGQGIGQQKAEEFYRHSLNCTEESIQKFCIDNTLAPYWAIAEKEGMQNPRWQQFEKIYQGEGSLGQRLYNVYHQLIEKYKLVIFVGADSPHLTANHYQNILNSFNEGRKSFGLGETQDGGYYIFLGTQPLSQDQWLNVEYSSNKTTEQFKQQLPQVLELESSFDVDTIEELKQLKSYLLDKGPKANCQEMLLYWLEQNL